MPHLPQCKESKVVDLQGIDDLSTEGAALLEAVTGRKVVEAHRSFEDWVNNGRKWLGDKFPNSGLSSQWLALPSSSLVEAGYYWADPYSIVKFKDAVQRRLNWLSALPEFMRRARESLPEKTQNEAKSSGRGEIKLQTTSRAFVDPERINELKNIISVDYDLTKMIRLCEEINLCFATECYFSMVMLMRAVIDHVPPIFGKRNFSEVANNYDGGKSFKKAMIRLENELRIIADSHLHSQIKKAESLPNITQIDFSNLIDLLLAEIMSILKAEVAGTS
jgi:hypothetical protein